MKHLINFLVVIFVLFTVWAVITRPPRFGPSVEEVVDICVKDKCSVVYEVRVRENTYLLTIHDGSNPTIIEKPKTEY